MTRPLPRKARILGQKTKRQWPVDSIWLKPQRVFKDLREFLAHLQTRGELKTIDTPVSPALELTEISRRVLAKRGPALLFTKASSRGVRVLSNLFGTEERVAAAIGHDSREALTELGRLLAALRAPQPPRSVGEAWRALPLLKEILNMAAKTVRNAPCQEVVVEGTAVDLADWPIQTCWPDDVAPLITWGLTTTRGPLHDRQNLGIYRQQVIGRNKIIMRWLAHRGGATDYRAFREKHPGERFPIAVSLGADPATIIAAVTPIPNTLSEYAFACPGYSLRMLTTAMRYEQASLGK
jgi:4-hydroxy-3-polyprenylbenzoate decarboxylase